MLLESELSVVKDPHKVKLAVGVRVQEKGGDQKKGEIVRQVHWTYLAGPIGWRAGLKFSVIPSLTCFRWFHYSKFYATFERKILSGTCSSIIKLSMV